MAVNSAAPAVVPGLVFAGGLDGHIRTLKADYQKYSSEGTLKKIWEQRPFDLPPPTLLNDAAEAARLARDWLAKKDFEMARHHLRTAYDRATKVESTLFHYSHGYRNPLEDE